jgi:hypothetical protein
MPRRQPPNGKPQPGTSPRAIAARDRQIHALQLRRSGATFQQIAEQLGYAHRSNARKAIQAALDGALSDEADALRALDLDRLDRLQLAHWPRATSGDVKATETVLKVMQHRAKLLGLYAPVQREVTFREEIAAMAEKVAADYGLDPGEIVAEAERFLSGDR